MPKNNIVKIQYGYDRPNEVEIITGFGAIAVGIFWATQFIPIVVRLGSLSQAFNLTALIFILALFLVGVHFYFHVQRVKSGDEARDIIIHGEKIIGTIKNLKVTNLRDMQSFDYDIDYDDSKWDKITAIITPAVIKDTMCITEKDLPIRAAIYVLGHKALVYALIDPPVAKMKKRKTAKMIWATFPYILTGIALVVSGILSSLSYSEIAFGIGFGGLIISTIIIIIQHPGTFTFK